MSEQQDAARTAAVTRRREECTEEVEKFLNDVAKGEFVPVNVAVIYMDANGNFGYYRPATELVNTIGMLAAAQILIANQGTGVNKVG